MNTKFRLIALILSVVLMISGLSMTIYATDGPGTDITPTTAPAPVVPDPTQAPDPVDPTQSPEPTMSPDPVTPTDAPVIDDNPSNTGDQQSGYIDNDWSNEYYTPDSSGSYTGEEDAGSVTGNTDLWETDIDEDSLKESQWSNITIDTSSNKKDVQNFSAIKTNSSDNGSWLNSLRKSLPIIGTICLILSLICFTYYAIATTKYKKKLKMLTQRELKHRASHQNSKESYGKSEYPTQAEYNRRYQNKRYSDTPYKSRRTAKQDTAEIPVRKHNPKH